MKDKILVNIYVSAINSDFDIYIPYNERIVNITKELTKVIMELSDSNFDPNYENHIIINRDNYYQYSIDQVIVDTDIRNGSRLIII